RVATSFSLFRLYEYFQEHLHWPASRCRDSGNARLVPELAICGSGASAAAVLAADNPASTTEVPGTIGLTVQRVFCQTHQRRRKREPGTCRRCAEKDKKRAAFLFFSTLGWPPIAGAAWTSARA